MGTRLYCRGSKRRHRYYIKQGLSLGQCATFDTGLHLSCSQNSTIKNKQRAATFGATRRYIKEAKDSSHWQ